MIYCKVYCEPERTGAWGAALPTPPRRCGTGAPLQLPPDRAVARPARSPSLLRSPARPSQPPRHGGRERGREGGGADARLRASPSSRAGARPRGGQGPGGRSGGKAARIQSRPNAALLNCPGHRSKGLSPLRRHRLSSLRAALVNEQGLGGHSCYRSAPKLHPGTRFLLKEAPISHAGATERTRTKNLNFINAL